MAPTEPTLRQLLRPGYLPAWALLGALRLTALLPHPLRRGLGRILGRVYRRASRRRRAVAATNLRVCFPHLSEAERDDLLRRHFLSVGQGLVEMGTAWWGRSRGLRALTRVEGLEHLEAARARGRGVILLSAHFTTLELGGRLLSFYAPFNVVYRRHEHPVIEWAMRRNRERLFRRAIPRNRVRQLIRSLQEGNAVWYAPDQDYRGKGAVFAPFFGVPASTNGATARIAAISGAPVVPFFPLRTRDGYLLRILAPLDGYPSGDPEADAARLNRLFEEEIRRAPEQYLWIHRRFKHRPPGAGPIYP